MPSALAGAKRSRRRRQKSGQMRAGRYEVYGHDGRRWLIDCVRDSRAAALMRCEELAEDARTGFTLLQVVDAGRAHGREMVIHEQAVHRKQASRPRMQTSPTASSWWITTPCTPGWWWVGCCGRSWTTNGSPRSNCCTTTPACPADARRPAVPAGAQPCRQPAGPPGRPAGRRAARGDRPRGPADHRTRPRRSRHAYADLSLAEGGLPAARTAPACRRDAGSGSPAAFRRDRALPAQPRRLDGQAAGAARSGRNGSEPAAR